LAVSQFRLGNEDSARDTLADLVRIFPNLDVPKGQFPPVFDRELGRAKQMIRKGKSGKVVIVGPKGAQVYWNGRLMGGLPLTLEGIPVGKHTLRVERGGQVFAE